jgi:LuxR family transcriptional regulator, maltose regulon positive regulatory protein
VLGDANIARYPPLTVLRCWEGVLTGDTALAERWAAVADAASFDGEPATGAASFDSARAQLRAGMCATGPEQMMADAAFSVALEPAWSLWRDSALWPLAEAHLLAGQPGEARTLFAEASTAAASMSSWDTIPVCEAQLAWLAMDRGEWREAANHLKLALDTIDAQRLHDYVFSLPAFAGAARLACIMAMPGSTPAAHPGGAGAPVSHLLPALPAGCGFSCPGCIWPSPSRPWSVSSCARSTMS